MGYTSIYDKLYLIFIAFRQCEAGNNLIFPRKTCGKPVPFHVFSLARG